MVSLACLLSMLLGEIGALCHYYYKYEEVGASMTAFFDKRLLVALFLFLGAFAAVVFIAYLRLSLVPLQVSVGETQSLLRGSIVDRSGTPLAVQTNFYNVGVTPHLIRDKQAFVADFAPFLGLSQDDILATIDDPDAPSFVYLKKKVDENIYNQLHELSQSKHYNFVVYDKVPGRFYPENALASSLIGFMGDDGKGLSGVEYSMQSYLSYGGSDNDHFASIDSNSEETSQQTNQPPSLSYNNIYLTIDAGLQSKLEDIAHETIDSTGAESLMMLAVDARDGEILTYISLPETNLNEYTNADDGAKVDRPAVYAYEPGSVFKIFTVASAYDAGVLKADDKFLCDGVYTKRASPRETVRIKCLEYHGVITASDALRFSCNDVLGQISDKMTDDYFIGKLKSMGFGAKTNIELPSETAGMVKDAGSTSWSARSKPTIAIGQEVSVSALQIVQAATAFAHGGVPLKLTVIKRITRKDGALVYEHTPLELTRTMSDRTASYLLGCMKETAETGTGSRARLHGVDIGVKTGTAQMASPSGGYSDTDFLSNCIAIFPIQSPRIILYIVVIKAQGETYAGRIVAPVIARASDEIIDYLGLSRDNAQSYTHTGRVSLDEVAVSPINAGEPLPDLTGLNLRAVRSLFTSSEALQDGRVTLSIHGSGWVIEQTPPAGTILNEGDCVELTLAME